MNLDESRPYWSSPSQEHTLINLHLCVLDEFPRWLTESCWPHLSIRHPVSGTQPACLRTNLYSETWKRACTCCRTTLSQRGQPLDRVIKDYQSSLVGGKSRSPDKYLVNPFTEKEKEKKKTRSTRRQSSKGTETEGKCRWFVNTAGRLTSSRNNRRRGRSGCN